MPRKYAYKGVIYYKCGLSHPLTGKPLYEVLNVKSATSKPYLTTIRECRDYIDKVTRKSPV